MLLSSILSSGGSFPGLIVRAWVRFTNNGINGAQSINGSFNVSGVTRNNTGTFVIASSLPDTNMIIQSGANSGNIGNTLVGYIVAQSATGATVATINPTSGAATDGAGYYIAFMG